jgi:hypothetical protein
VNGMRRIRPRKYAEIIYRNFYITIVLLMTHMKIKELLIIGVILQLILIIGCTTPYQQKTITQSTPSPVPKTTTIPDPENSLKAYVYAFNHVIDSELFRLLSKNVIDSESKDSIHNTAFALASNRVTFSEYTILTKNVQGNSAILNVEIVENVQGYRKTTTRDITFVFEDGIWKLNEFLLPE